MSEKFQVGQIVEGTINSIKPFGAFVTLDESTQGLVHISQISQGYLKDIHEAVSVGDKVKVKILSIDEKNNKISLSMKEASETKAADNTVNSTQASPGKDRLEDMLKDFLKVSNEKQAALNKRNNR
ncbi:MAG TPA: S1 RNA-binding domain-containing protein [Defluviitaleaceae bacterium]|jgi:general stress protein 13|nr:S1 RNA-binding domain-containing protein [Candidatus Epulonipiscium sp.]HOQ16082.1 S1 RNA-binding domain-containing protein [Defluviitaleaceae bacterium]HPT75826.1 S1 RNA-binding domain-containing protein [Defluviitaleaceae bacterium]HQD50759.1 S1 RNA-binding domain-containing protein [Defluviitaleaceae bacterium]